MKIRFEDYAHKLQLKLTMDAVLSNPDFKINRKEAELFNEIMKRLSSNKIEDKWKKEQVVTLYQVISQVMDHREAHQEEATKDMTDEEKQFYAMDNNTFLIVLDLLNNKLGFSKEKKIVG